MAFYPPVAGLFDEAFDFAALVEQLTEYGTKVGLSRVQAQEVIRVTWTYYENRGFMFDLLAPEIRNNMVKWSFGERWRP